MESANYFNPYSGQSFFGFFFVLLQRLWGFLTGEFPMSSLATDEIQVLVLAGVAASSALVGTFLILRRMTMLANSLSHTILIGIVFAYLMSTQQSIGHTYSIDIQPMLIAALVMGVLTAFLTEFLTKTARLQEDASTGIVFTSLFAFGIILVTLLTRNAHIGTEVVMGNVDALQIGDFQLVLLVLAANIVFFTLFYKEYLITTFDPALARAVGISVGFFNYLLMIQVSATVIGAFRAVGVLMVLSFITGPSLTARLLTHDLKRLLIYSVISGCVSAVVGVALARHMLSMYDVALSTGGIVVCVIAAQYLLFLIYTLVRSRFSRENIADQQVVI